jgi:hypothetical protein
MASIRTISASNGEIEISIAPGCEEEIFSVLKYLKGEGVLEMLKRLSLRG